jgi:hypothetical protein
MQMNLKKKLWIILGITSFIIVGSLTFGFYEYTQSDADPADGKPQITVGAKTLFNDFVRNEQEANQKYFNKLTRAHGILKAIDKDKTDMASLSLDAGDSASEIFCQLDPRHTADIDRFAPGDTIEVQGICAGRLTDVLLVGCSVKRQEIKIKKL